MVISCEKKQFPHTIDIDGNVPGAFYTFYRGFQVSGASAYSNGDMTLIITNTEPEIFIDSITGEKTGYTKWKVINQTIGEYKSYTVILEETK